MKLLMRTHALMVMLVGILSSCFAPKNLNKENKPFTDDILSKIKPGKRYKFELKTGPSQSVYVTGVADQTITGFYYQEQGKGEKRTKSNFSASFKNIQEDVAKIYVRKFNPILTTVAIVVPTTLGIALIVKELEEPWGP